MIWSILQSIADHNEMGNGFPFEEPGPQSKRLWLHSFRRNAQNIALQLQQQMFEILTKFEEQSNELNELREKLKKYETWDPDVDKYGVVQSRSVRHRHLLVNFQSTSRKKF